MREASLSVTHGLLLLDGWPWCDQARCHCSSNEQGWSRCG